MFTDIEFTKNYYTTKYRIKNFFANFKELQKHLQIYIYIIDHDAGSAFP